MLWNAAVLAGYPYNDPTTGYMNSERYQFHAETKMALIAYQATAFGLFNRMFNGTLDDMNPGFRGFYKANETQQRYDRIQRVMHQTGLSVTQVVLGYLISQPDFVTVPIVGSRTVEQVIDSMSAAAVRLTPEQVRAIA